VLNPEGGGGRIVAAGTPEQVVAAGSHTGDALRAVLARREFGDRDRHKADS
jgi:excinuclease ABC subunit A